MCALPGLELRVHTEPEESHKSTGSACVFRHCCKVDIQRIETINRIEHSSQNKNEFPLLLDIRTDTAYCY